MGRGDHRTRRAFRRPAGLATAAVWLTLVSPAAAQNFDVTSNADTVGGTTAGAGNVVSGNSGAGVRLATGSRASFCDSPKRARADSTP